jgi:O-acetyl-ADP-ribose deacetylase (regulator of RNase III)
MIELRQGDILKAKADALVNMVNCVGVMGRGVALQFRKTYERFDRVVKVIEGFETPFGMELLSTVQWIAKYEGATEPAKRLAKLMRGTNASGCSRSSTFV